MESRNPTEQADHVSSQPNLFDAQAFPPASDAAAGGNAQPRSEETAPVVTGWRLWAERVSLVIYVAFCIELGIVLTVVPWVKVWTDNALIARFPFLHALVQDNFFRGVVTGLGLVDIWLGVSEAVHYRELKPKPAERPATGN